MAQKTQHASSSDNQPNSASSSTKDSPDSGSTRKRQNSRTSSSPSASQQTKSLDSKDPSGNDSQVTTKATSSGSVPAPKESMAGPSPYGTRSRNRGQARPNYAEDRDMDVDMYDAYTDKKGEDHKKSSRQAAAAANGATDSARSTASTSRKGTDPDNGKVGGSHATATAKDSHANGATSATSAGATTTTNPSKKRKAPAQSTPNNAHSQSHTSASGASVAAGTRRSAAHQAVAPPSGGYKETNVLSFEKSGAILEDGKLIADDGTVLGRNDHAYLICEPPGEPYYLGRIMEFLHAQNDSRKPVEALRINWYYRPKDIGKKVNDTRVLFATMHSDTSPLHSLRGKCEIRHKAEIENLEAYRKTPDSFWFEKLYDRYIQKYYEVIPCFQIVNVPERVKKVLDERWKYIIVEQGRSKEFTSAVKLCKRCGGYCASNDSVDCAVCQQTYHMTCVRPPLLKKPSRGFGWACAACNLAQERKLEARNTPSLLDQPQEAEEEENWDEEDEGVNTNRMSDADDVDDTHHPATAEQIYQASLWPYRYLGMHCKPEDALDYDDRIYPRAGSRLGPRHQATVLPWPGRPVKLVKPLEIKKVGKKDSKQAKEAQAALEAERLARENRPKWIQDEPPGYVARGEDFPNDDPNNTATLLWQPPAAVGSSIRDSEVDSYVLEAKAKVIPALSLPPESTNLLDVATQTLYRNNFDTEVSLKKVAKTEKSEFKEPELSPAEIKKFEEGISKFGSELYSTTKHVKTVDHWRIVRFYYTWKKTQRGKQIWGNFAGRKGKKEAKIAEANANKLQDDVADSNDDSAFDTEKALERKRTFMCKFCSTKSSRQWRRAPAGGSVFITEGGGKNKDKVQHIAALCRRCAELWRRYAIQWEDVEDLAKKVAAAGGRSWKRRVDEELLKELTAANEMMNKTTYNTLTPPAAQPNAAAQSTQSAGSEQPRKKLKSSADKDGEPHNSESGATTSLAQQKKKEKVAEKPAPPPIPDIPKPRILPCAICNQMNPTGEGNHLSCKECRLTVHRKCYGVIDNRQPGKWTCDMCLNDKNPQVSIEYKCVLCPVEFTEHGFVEPPRNTHKKKSEKEREKERVEREAAQKAADYWRKKQEEMNRPVNPREPLKRTADNNWVHVTCAVFTPEVKFGKAKALSPSEGIPSIPRARYEEVCKACKQKGGACVACHHCRSPMHVECAHKHGYLLGFEITPVKGSRRDQHNIVTINGETGVMSAAIWCKEHIPTRTVVHRMHDLVNQTEGDKNLNALQLYVENFKQADLTLTGTVRKANLIHLATKNPTAVLANNTPRRQSATTIPNGSSSHRASSIENHADSNSLVPQSGDKVCITCGIDVSPKWWPIDKDQEKVIANGNYGSLGSEAQKFLAQRSFQCHKCKKAGRKPVCRAPSSVEALPPVEHPMAPPVTAPALRSPPPHVSHAVNRLSDFGNPWGGRAPVVQAPAHQAGPPPVAPPALHAPSVGPPASLALNPPGPSPMAAPGHPPVPPHHYGPPSTSYGDWHRGATQHPAVPIHQMNGGSGGPGPIHHSALRDLRPPPIAPVAHHQTPPLQHGLGQQMVNGVPPSPPRRGPPSVQNGTDYFLSVRHSQQHTAAHQSQEMVSRCTLNQV
ncbi:hypothetical protein DL771_011857 [Monosporascus sp. 5C6A]|nr:hypothetical protein DL771_011857 [Monosporascus sp. 5C6A]